VAGRDDWLTTRLGSPPELVDDYRVSLVKSNRQRCHPLRWVLDSVREEVMDHCRDLRRMCLKGEVARVEEMDRRVGNVASECLFRL
jgi:hypothetical protein